MRKASLVIVLAALLGVGSAAGGSRPAIAAAEDGMSAVRGVGMLTCGQFIGLIEEQSPGVEMVAGWIDGFTTGLNATTRGVFDHLPWQRTDLVLQLIANHCAQNRDRILADAVNAFIHFTRATRLDSSSDVVEIPAGDGGPIDIYRATLMQVQRALADLGHYTSTVDGAYGPGTAAAIRAFQAAQSLPENGLPDQTTLLVLFGPLFEAGN